MREVVASMAESSKSAIFVLALVAGFGTGLGFAAVMEIKQALFPYKPTSELCKALAL